MELFVDFVVPTSPDERRSEVPLAGLTDRRQAGCLQVVVEALHLIGRLLWREEDENNTDVKWFKLPFKSAVATVTRCGSKCSPRTSSSSSATWIRRMDTSPPAPSGPGRSGQDRRLPPTTGVLLLLCLFKVPLSEVLLVLFPSVAVGGGAEALDGDSQTG